MESLSSSANLGNSKINCSCAGSLFLAPFFSPALVCGHANERVCSQAIKRFMPTAKIHSYNTRSSFSSNFYIKKNQKLKLNENHFQESVCNFADKIPTKLQTPPKLIFKRKIRMNLFSILESQDSYEDLESIISQVRKYSQQLSPLFRLSCSLPTSINYIAVSVDLNCFRIYLFIYLSVAVSVYFIFLLLTILACLD